MALGSLLALGSVACDSAKKDAAGDKKADGDKKAKAGGKKAGGDEKKADGPSEIVLEKLGLKGTGPAGAKVSEMMGNQMVQAPGLVATVGEAKDDKLATADKAKADAEMYTPLNWKSEDVDGGYVATFENKGGAGSNYWVKSYRKIGEKAYTCETTASQPEQQKNAVDFCKSLAAK